MSPTPDSILAFISAVDVGRCAAFLPTTLDVDGQPMPVTRCNSYAVVYCAAFNAPLPNAPANDQNDWLHSNEAKMGGWAPCDALTAALRASLGYVVLASWKNPAGHGHIAAVVPAPVADPSGTYVSAAGAQNFVRARIEKSFGAIKPEFFTKSDVPTFA